MGNKRPKSAKSDGAKVLNYMLHHGDWRTAEYICSYLGYDLVKKLGSIKSRLRDIDIMENGFYKKETRWVNGVMEYRVKVRVPGQGDLFSEFRQHVEDYTHPDNGRA